MLPAECGDDTAPRRALEEAELQEIGLVDVLDGVLLLAEGDRECREADRPAAELVGDGEEQLSICPLEPHFVDLEELQRLTRDIESDSPSMAHLGDVSDPAKNPVGDPRCATSSACDLFRGAVLEGRAPDLAALGSSFAVVIVGLPFAYLWFKHVDATMADLV